MSTVLSNVPFLYSFSLKNYIPPQLVVGTISVLFQQLIFT
jgi:hypothetical protein